MISRALLLICITFITSCGPAGAVKMLLAGGGGPKIAANTQAGKTNVQAVGKTAITSVKNVRPQARTIEQSSGETGVRAEAVQSVTVNNEASPWVWLALIVVAFVGGVFAADNIRGLTARRQKPHAGV